MTSSSPKCVAGRERIWEYARTALAEGMVEIEILLSRVDTLPVSERRPSRTAAKYAFAKTFM
jgi:hypothetical protein